MGGVGTRIANRLACAAALAGLSVAAATVPPAAPATAQGQLLQAASTKAPTLRMTDPADTPGKLDLRSVRLTQSGGSLELTFRVNERFRAQFRMEAYDWLNHNNLGNPNLNMKNADFGRIVNRNGNRTMQASLRLFF